MYKARNVLNFFFWKGSIWHKVCLDKSIFVCFCCGWDSLCCYCVQSQRRVRRPGKYLPKLCTWLHHLSRTVCEMFIVHHLTLQFCHKRCDPDSLFVALLSFSSNAHSVLSQVKAAHSNSHDNTKDWLPYVCDPSSEGLSHFTYLYFICIQYMSVHSHTLSQAQVIHST